MDQFFNDLLHDDDIYHGGALFGGAFADQGTAAGFGSTLPIGALASMPRYLQSTATSSTSPSRSRPAARPIR